MGLGILLPSESVRKLSKPTSIPTSLSDFVMYTGGTFSQINDVEFIIYGITIIKIKDKEFRLTKNSSGFPRFVDDERLELLK